MSEFLIPFFATRSSDLNRVHFSPKSLHVILAVIAWYPLSTQRAGVQISGCITVKCPGSNPVSYWEVVVEIYLFSWWLNVELKNPTFLLRHLSTNFENFWWIPGLMFWTLQGQNYVLNRSKVQITEKKDDRPSGIRTAKPLISRQEC